MPLAWLNLTHDRRRFALFSLGISLAVALMFMQYGFYNALLDSNTLLIEKLNADLVIVNAREASIAIREPFSRHRLAQAAEVPGVRSVHPLFLEYNLSLLRNPAASDEQSAVRPIRVIGVDPDQFLLDVPELDPRPEAPRSRVRELKLLGRALFDRRSKPGTKPTESIYGPLAAGADTDLADQRVHIVGEFDLGTDFAAEGTLIVSADTFAEILRRPYDPAGPFGQVEIGLVRLQDGADPRRVRDQLAQAMPEGDVVALTRDEFVQREKNFWLHNTPIGFVFGAGVIVGFVVGMVICYQILSSDVADHLSEYATLKAIGYPNRYLSGVVLQQALLMAVAGFFPGLILTVLLYQYLGNCTGLPMWLSLDRIGFIALLTLLMCAGSGLLALRKAQKVDPAEVF
jgi:putative ABC transport system permease protein